MTIFKTFNRQVVVLQRFFIGVHFTNFRLVGIYRRLTIPEAQLKHMHFSIRLHSHLLTLFIFYHVYTDQNSMIALCTCK